MKMLRIRANCMREALAEARRRLGDDATILHTRQYEEPVLFGLLRKRGVEIVAASDTQMAVSDQLVKSPPTPVDLGTPQLANVEHEVGEIRKTLAELMSGLAVVRHQEVSPLVERLIKSGVCQSIAENVLKDIDPESTQDAIGAIAGRIKCSGEPNCGTNQVRIAIVGPTGVGKTTTAAKLAARFTLAHKKRVALLTLDTYRVGAVEQLATYARILGISLEVALSPEDVEALIAKHADKDVIIIDTVGRSQRNGEQITELGSFLKIARPTEVHLALSASADSVVRREAVSSFGRLGVDRIILTKLDECAQGGCALELAVTGLVPYSYVTCGQDVPDDISVADSESLARFVWEGAL